MCFTILDLTLNYIDMKNNNIKIINNLIIIIIHLIQFHLYLFACHSVICDGVSVCIHMICCFLCLGDCCLFAFGCLICLLLLSICVCFCRRFFVFVEFKLVV